MGEDATERRAELAQNTDYHADALRRRRARESADAQVLIDQFVGRAKDAQLPTTELMARPWS